MRKCITIIAGLATLAGVASARTYPYTKLVDLSAADSTSFYFSGTTNSAYSVPGPSGSGWSLWVMNGVSMSCSDVDLIVWPMDDDGNVSTYSGDAVTLATALDLSDTTTVRHFSLGTLPRCAGVKIIVTPTSGSGTMRMKLFYDAE